MARSAKSAICAFATGLVFLAGGGVAKAQDGEPLMICALSIADNDTMQRLLAQTDEALPACQKSVHAREKVAAMCRSCRPWRDSFRALDAWFKAHPDCLKVDWLKEMRKDATSISKRCGN